MRSLPSLRCRLALVLAFALVAAQALGLMHRIVHGPLAHPVHASLAPGAQAHLHDGDHNHAHADGHHPHGSSWLAALFTGHGDDSTCRLSDPLSQEGLPGVPALVLPLAFGSFFLDRFQGEFLARWAALFDARGPPVLR